MNIKRIVITGGPGTGKSSIITELLKRGYTCLEEISRQVILDARKDGIDQLFLKDPLLFSKLLLEGRKKQYLEALDYKDPLVFMDRGLPDVLAYMDFIGDTYPSDFKEICKTHVYDYVFILEPWQEIFTQDNERYESFEQAVKIHHHLLETYQKYDYNLLDVPFDSVESRANHILEVIKSM